MSISGVPRLQLVTLQRGVCRAYLCWVLTGFLLFVFRFILLLSLCVSPSTLHMTSTIFYLDHNDRFFSGVGAWRLLFVSLVNVDSFLEEDLVTHFAVLSNSQKTSLCLKKPSEIWSALVRCRNTCTFCRLSEAPDWVHLCRRC